MIKWISDNKIDVNGTEFLIAAWSASKQKGLPVLKEPHHIECYAALASEIAPGANIVELGIHAGGSTALMAALYKPRILCAVDLSEAASPAFTQFMNKHPDGQRIHAHFEVDQGDVDKLSFILQAEFQGEALDLVVDDASHLYAPSLASFNLLFPRLRPGGIYVVEDWSWEHFLERREGPGPLAEHATGFARLTLVAALASAAYPEYVAKVTFMRGIVVIHRGHEEIGGAQFDIRDLLGTRGTALLS